MAVATRWGIGVLLMVLLPWCARAGDVLHHHIGDTITPAEAEQYLLFEDIEDLKQVDVIAHRYLARTYQLVIQTMEDDSVSAYEITFGEEALELMALSLHHADSLTYGQHPGDLPLISVRATSGYVATGQFGRWTGTGIVVSHEYGTNTIPLVDIDEISILTSTRAKPFKPNGYGINPNRNRLLMMPTGHSLDAGEGYFGVYEIVIPMVHVGLGYNISVGAGVFPVFTGDFSLGYLSAQVGLIDEDERALAIGNLTVLANFDDEETNSVGINYISGSVGPPERTMSFGVGFGFTPDGIEETPFIVIGGQYQLGRRTALISENWIVPGTDVPVVSMGLRWFSETISTDFALLTPLQGDGFVAIPWVNFVVLFGHKD